MNDETPVLLMGYNRPDQMRGLIQSLSLLKPKLVLLSIDGPRADRTKDIEMVSQTRALVGEIKWNARICTRFRDTHLGLRGAVVDAVTWANSEFGKVIVLEDDVRAGPQLLDFLDRKLEFHATDPEIAHINGYNLVPSDFIKRPGHDSRLSIYPESYAWATWDRAWKEYDDKLTWARNASISDLRDICGSTVGALRWKQNFADAAAGRIDTWAYRWLASLWGNKRLVVSPNQNLSRYQGWYGGTHTFRKLKNKEPEIKKLLGIEPNYKELNPDADSDEWLGRNVFSETWSGVFSGSIVSTVLSLKKRISDR